MLEHELTGSAEMLSLSGSYLAAYSYRQGEDNTPTLLIWNWEQRRLVAQHPVPWLITNEVSENATVVLGLPRYRKDTMPDILPFI